MILVILGIQAQYAPAYLISLFLLLLNAMECITRVLIEEVKASNESKDSSSILNMYDVLKDRLALYCQSYIILEFCTRPLC